MNTSHFADRLIQACREKKTPICVGIDPVYEKLPASLRREINPGQSTEISPRLQCIDSFCREVFRIVTPHVPCVKIQSACFERYGWQGLQVCHELIVQAKRQGLINIYDAKRGDIGVSSEHYAVGCLADSAGQPGPDSLTVNPYMGLDTISPFISTAASQGKGLFALVRTSNPGSDAIQAIKLDNGQSVAQAMARQVDQVGQAVLGNSGYSLLGAVVGATKASEAAELRQLMPRQIFLVPGFGAQGGKADDVKACFNADGLGAIITASRSILYAYEKPLREDWSKAIEQATLAMKAEIAEILA